MKVFQFLQTKNMQNMTGLPCGHHTRASDRIASDIFTCCRILIYSLPGSNCFSFNFRNFVTVPCWTLWVQDIICSSVLVGAIGLAMCWDVGKSHGWLEHIETMKSCKIKSCELLLPYGRLFFCFQDENLNFKQNFEDLVKARPPESGGGFVLVSGIGLRNLMGSLYRMTTKLTNDK